MPPTPPQPQRDHGSGYNMPPQLPGLGQDPMIGLNDPWKAPTGKPLYASPTDSMGPGPIAHSHRGWDQWSTGNQWGQQQWTDNTKWDQDGLWQTQASHMTATSWDTQPNPQHATDWRSGFQE